MNQEERDLEKQDDLLDVNVRGTWTVLEAPALDRLLIDMLPRGLKAALDDGLRAGCKPQEILDHVRVSCLAQGVGECSLTELQVWAYLESATGARLKAPGGEEVAL